jgi:putative phosphoesterase
MKITILSDIHGNLPALQAVLRHARGCEADDLIINLGDSVGYGPEPDKVVQMLQGKHVINLLGDYDKKVLSKKHREEGWARVENPDKRLMFHWTYQKLSKRSRKLIENYPAQNLIEIEGVKIFMTHTTPGSNYEFLGPDTPDKTLEKIAKEIKTDIILCGHSHRAFVRQVNEVLFINPGSVGRPDDADPRSSYAILEIVDGKPKVELVRFPYNLMAAIQSIRQSGLPEVFAQVILQGMNYDDVLAKFDKNIPKPSLSPSGILTLLTDFGLADHFVGVMKGVILNIAPHVKIVDIGHQVRPQNVMQGALMLDESVPYFPPGTVHVAVVDPGVGTQRRAIAAKIGSHFFVAPDNGLLSLVIQKAQENGEPVEIFTLDQPEYWLPDISRSFHGRDIFSPVGAHIVNGTPLEMLGSPLVDPILLKIPEPKQTDYGWQGEVVLVDIFGNLSTNLPAQTIEPNTDQFAVVIQDIIVKGLTRTFGDSEPGSLIATIDSRGMLAISVVNGSAKDRLNADVGSMVQIIFGEHKTQNL